jgi:PAS domain S-box-containing protein
MPSTRLPVRAVLRRTLIALAFFALVAVPTRALDPDRPISQYLVDFWQEGAGLPQKFVTAIVQTRDGYIWLGTKGGVARFDGQRFKVYDDTRRDGLREAEVWALAEDQEDGSLWIGTYGAGLSNLKGEKLTHYSTKDGLPKDFITSIQAGADGSMWFGTTDGLARRKGGQFTKYTTVDGLPSSNISQLHVDRQGVLWVATARGLVSYQNARFVNHAQKHPELGVTLTVADNGQGGLWLGSRNVGLFRYQDDSLTTYSARDGLPSGAIASLWPDPHGTLWIATLDGLSRFRNGRFESYYSEVSGVGNQGSLEMVSLRNLQTLAMDREGSLWIGTRFDGLARLRDSLVSNFTGGDATDQSVDVRCVLQDRAGAVWLGTTNGVRRLQDGAVTVIPGHNTASIAQDRAGRIWIGTNNGVFMLQGDKWIPSGDATLDRTAITAMIDDGRGGLWIGARDTGVYRYTAEGVTQYTSRAGLLGDQVRALALDSRGALWIGTKDGGVSCLRAGRFTTFGVKENLPSEAAQAVFIDKDDVVWVGTRRGIARIKDQKIAVITAESGLPANYFYQIMEDDHGAFWMTFGRGIVRVAKAELSAVADGKAHQVKVETFGSESGMRSTLMAAGNQPGICKLSDGRLWFATARSAVVVDPKSMARNTIEPPVHVEELVYKGKTQPAVDGLKLAPGSGELEIHFTGLSFIAPERMKFKYKLEPYDRDWVDAGNRRIAYYTNLPPKSYRFSVKACNNDGKWNEKGDSFSFVLQAPFWRTPWFLTLGAIAVAAALIGIYVWRVRQIKENERLLAQRVEERTRDLKLAEEEAGRERDLLHALMDNSPDLIYFKDESSRFTRINKAHAAALSLTDPHEAVGKTDFDFRGQGFAQKAQQDESDLIKSGRAMQETVEHDPLSGRWYLSSKVPLHDKDGGAAGLVGISKDITERKNAEEKLERDLAALLTVVNRVASGDLTPRGAEADDTLGRIARAVNQLIDSFSNILAGISDAALSVSSSATEILAASTQIAKGAKYGSDEVHSTSAAVDEMAASMSEVSRNAEQSAEGARRVLEHLQASAASVNATALGMTRIDGAVSETAEKMRLLDKRSKQIFDIIHLIEEIASQSTLLSLNAAIEAAHAGDAGRGFGVVAEEIRRLAERSSESIKEVSAIVEGIVEETRLVLSAMENGIREVVSGRELSEQAQGSLQTIRELVDQSVVLSEQIFRASREQVKATQTVSQAMQTISNITEQSAAGSSEASRAVQDLVALSEQLRKAITRFKISAPADSERGSTV